MKKTKRDRIRLQTTIDKELLNRLKHFAVDNHLNLNDILEEAVELYLDSHNKKELKKPQK